jgi:acylphosphatase
MGFGGRPHRAERHGRPLRIERVTQNLARHASRVTFHGVPMGKDKSKTSNQAHLHAIVSGIVQGVNFRYYTARQAETLSVTGWVANRWDGAVQVVAEGTRAELEALLDWLGHGPPSARVDGVEATWEEPTGEYTTFRVRYL